MRFSRMEHASAWESREVLLDFLGEQLALGRLTVILGAGVSFGFGLPSWQELIECMEAELGMPTPSAALNFEQRADRILHSGCNDSETQLADLARLCLYRNYKDTFSALSDWPLMRALGALMMASARGSVSAVISFNFDDLLERYLEFHGFVVRRVGRLPEWAGREDVTVYHPHGLLPSRDIDATTPIVLASVQFERIIGMASDKWQQLMLVTMRAHTCLFVGLSGDDKRLKAVLEDVGGSHVSQEGRDAFWGVRFALEGDAQEPMWRERGVFQHTIGSHAELPDVLLEICQLASRASGSRFEESEAEG